MLPSSFFNSSAPQFRGVSSYIFDYTELFCDSVIHVFTVLVLSCEFSEKAGPHFKDGTQFEYDVLLASGTVDKKNRLRIISTPGKLYFVGYTSI